MGTVIQVDTTNDGNFQARKLVDPGVYKLAISNKPLQITKGKNPPYNNIIKLELKVLFNADGSETPFRGQTVYDNLAITKSSEWKLTHFAMSGGAYTKEDLKANGGNIDMDRLNEIEEVTAKIEVEVPTEGSGSTTNKPKNIVGQYVFEGA